MKKILTSMLVFSASILLSGCSLVPQSSIMGKKKANVVMPWDKSANSPLEDKIIIGSIWKSGNNGGKFESKSKIDREAVTSVEGGGVDANDATNKKNGTDGVKSENSNGELISTADILSIAFHPFKEKTIYVSTANDGLFKTVDAGELWKPIPFPPKNVYSFILDRKDPDNRMFASGVVGEWGKIFRTSDGGENWEEVYAEPGDKVPITALAQHPVENNIIIAGTKNGTIIKSTDSGDTWKNVGKFEGGANIYGNIGDFAFDSSDRSFVYLMVTGGRVYFSKSTGERWLDWEVIKQNELSDMKRRKVSQKIINDYANRMRIEGMPAGIVSMAADPKISGVIYAGTNRGFFVSNSFGKWWKPLDIIESAKGFPIRSIAINPNNSKETVFVAGKAFYRSTDSGLTWSMTGLDVDRDVSFVAYDPFDPTYIFAGLRRFK